MFSSFFLAFILSFIGPSLAQKKMCPKIFFQNIDENVLPWVQVEGVYELFSNNDGFPVYLNRPSGLFFYYRDLTSQGEKLLAFGLKVTETFGAVGRLSNDFDPKTWLSSGLLNKKDLFGDVVKEWSYYSPLDKTFKTVLGPPYIKAICVDDEYFRCNSGKVYLNDTVTGNQAEILNDPRTDFFAKVPNVYESIRSVFKHSRQEWYLYYRDGYWRVGTSYTGSGTDLLRTKDLAHRPEYVTNYWESWTTKGWTAGSGLRMKCRGIANGENECYDKPCNGQGTCVYTADNETVCLCQDSTHGPNCENKDACSDPGIPANSIEVVHAGNRPGDISTSFCATGYRSSPVEFFVCEQDHGRKNWLLESKATCQVPPPITSGPIPPHTSVPAPGPFPYPTGNPENIPTSKKALDQSEAFMIFVIAFFACHVLCPTFVWLGIMLVKIVRFSQRSRPGSPERLEAVQNAMQSRYMLMIRVYSIFMNFTFWVWLCAVCACLATGDGKARSFTFYWAAVMCGVCAVFVTLEAFFSSERAALHNMFSWEYVKSLQREPPSTEMVIDRYEWKHQRMAVYRTNVLTGRQEYQGSEDRWSKVGRKTVRQPFVYSSWCDESNLEVCENGRLFRLRVHIDITLDRTAAESFEVQKSALIEKTRHLNHHFDFSRVDSVANHHPYVVLYHKKESVPFWMNEQFFWCFTFLQLSWIYRWLFVSQTSSLQFTLRKKVFCQPVFSEQTAFKQVYPAQTVPGAHDDIIQDIDAANKPLLSNQQNSTNYLSV